MEPNPLCAQLPVFDLAVFLGAADKGAPEVQRLCAALAACLQQSSALVVRDPRVDTADNDAFLSLLERYFSQPLEVKMADVRPELAYQVGATPEGVEKPRCLRDASIMAHAASLAPEDRPTLPSEADPKWRFFHRLGDRPAATQYPELNAEPVLPAAFPEWRQVMDGWGGKLLGAVATVAEMAARGFGLEADAFTARMQHAPHLLAPTGADLDRHGRLGTVVAGFHYDLNFLTIHGRSRFPGLYAWLANGRRIPVRIPEGCLLLQAGKQMEWLTGGHVRAGWHEVVCTEETVAAAEAARAQGRPTWRVSSTVFSQIASDVVLQPLGRFAAEPGAAAACPPTPAGRQVAEELEMINLKAC
ncbi:hypothetical protein CHLNCDRAFT_19374 [Chlorella variabilis]|uniref:Isopenicillin N synthase-like Fe(2+) 2OG dioxygenase domain-containing protein n=1 Tax=Chlorella variabilis TaxID=554065 RepID=E1Z4X8_CHLVA|nr:hypothetical protein CHLNCDRAFT_19374 [Chlorella variabilis]EFN59425.1 hypothetical protein CHLNCDRAFT_19374 [Chlorella variabilis]|eukprot:XP_005851527.1 hypothetical protein CHLNCDRAFT_19374 [Chlorella variabilis]